MSQPETSLPPAGEGEKTYFSRVAYWKGRWRFAITGGSAPLASLAGCTVSIGDKDGGVWEAVTVTAVDERTGQVTVTGGGFGVCFRDTEAKPFEGTMTIEAHDIARGLIHGKPALDRP